MGFRVVLSSLMVCVAQFRALFACLLLPLCLGLFMSWLLLTMVTGSAWLRPPFWILAMNGFISYFPFLFIGVAILLLLAQSTFAVGWHRFLMREEKPQTLSMPTADLVMRYLFLSLMLSFSYVVLAYFVSLFAGVLFQLFPLRSDGLVGWLVIGALGALMTYVMLRLALILPASAVDEELTLHQSWDATGAEKGAVAEIAVVLTMLSLALDIVFGFLPVGWYGQVAVYFVSGLLMSILSITSLSLLYGSLIEGRRLPV